MVREIIIYNRAIHSHDEAERVSFTHNHMYAVVSFCIQTLEAPHRSVFYMFTLIKSIAQYFSSC